MLLLLLLRGWWMNRGDQLNPSLCFPLNSFANLGGIRGPALHHHSLWLAIGPHVLNTYLQISISLDVMCLSKQISDCKHGYEILQTFKYEEGFLNLLRATLAVHVYLKRNISRLLCRLLLLRLLLFLWGRKEETLLVGTIYKDEIRKRNATATFVQKISVYKRTFSD